jgi:hypothetical protein
MTRLVLIFAAVCILIGTTSFQTVTSPNEFDWSNINEFKFYGFVDPTKIKKTKFVMADTEKIKSIFSNLKQSDVFLPKGASRFATIKFKNKNKMLIQIISGGCSSFRVVKKDIFADSWFAFDSGKTTEWLEYINELTEKIEK